MPIFIEFSDWMLKVLFKLKCKPNLENLNLTIIINKLVTKHKLIKSVEIYVKSWRLRRLSKVLLLYHIKQKQINLFTWWCGWTVCWLNFEPTTLSVFPQQLLQWAVPSLSMLLIFHVICGKFNNHKLPVIIVLTELVIEHFNNCSFIV